MKDDALIRKIHVNGERRVEVFCQHIRYNHKRHHIESIGLPLSYIAARYCKRWTRLNLSQWIGPMVTGANDIRWSQDFLKALAWAMGTDK